MFKHATSSFALTLAALSWCIVGCGLRSEETEPIDVDTATQVAALTVYQEGTDALEPTLDEPLLVTECGYDRIRAEIVERFDTNGDGEVTGQERDALTEAFGALPKAAKRAALWAKAVTNHGELLRRVYDMDNSGSLSDDERTALKHDLQTRCETRRALVLEQFDEDEDGKLNAEETVLVLEYLKDRFATKKAELLESYDTDSDGTLDRGERLVARDDRRAVWRQLVLDLAEEYDTNHDNDWDRDEVTALREYLQEWIRGEHFGERNQ